MTTATTETPRSRWRATRRVALTAVALFVASLALDGRRLASSPPYFYHDEVMFALNGHSIATTGRDLNGILLPLFIRTFAFVPPIAIYMRVILFLFLPVSIAVARIPGVVIAALDVVTAYLAARRLFRREDLGVLAAVFVLLTPTHLIHARLGGDHIFAIPFFNLFLLFLVTYVEERRLSALCAATACLGFGIYGYNGAMTSMPVFLAMTWALLAWLVRERTLRPYLVAVGGFMLPLLPMIPWLIVHPEQIGHQLRSYNVQTGGTSATHAVAGAWHALVVRLDDYHGFFDPSLLFFKGDGSLLDSTREVGVFLLPFAVLLAAGLYYSLRHHRTLADRVVLASFFAAPLGALVVDEVKMTRALVLVPLGAIVAARGVEGMMRSRALIWRVLAAALLCALAVQYVRFDRDYFGDYRARAASAFENDRDGALDALVARSGRNGSSPMFVSNEIPMMDYRWRLYMIARERSDLHRRLAFIDERFDLAAAPPGSVFLGPYTDDGGGRLERIPALKRVDIIEDISRHPSFAVYEKIAP